MLVNVVTGEQSNCQPDVAEPECTTDTPIRLLQIEKSSSPEVADPGDLVTYTITVTNTGAFAYTAQDPASFQDDVSEVLDDATYNDDASATAGIAVMIEPLLLWAGPLPIGEQVVVTYSVTVDDAPAGDLMLTNVVTDGPESNCRPESVVPECTTETPVRLLEVQKTADREVVEAGGTVAYTITIENVGLADFTLDDPATLSDDMSDVLDDASYNDDATATAGTVTFDTPTLSWSGPVAVGETVTITYSVTTSEPIAGDGQIRNVVVIPASNCSDGCDNTVVAPLPPTGAGDMTAFAVGGFAALAAGMLLAFTAWARRAARRAQPMDITASTAEPTP
jgi:uncharacterized repeat protein (TIGR01451 family)